MTERERAITTGDLDVRIEEVRGDLRESVALLGGRVTALGLQVEGTGSLLRTQLESLTARVAELCERVERADRKSVRALLDGSEHKSATAEELHALEVRMREEQVRGLEQLRRELGPRALAKLSPAQRRALKIVAAVLALAASAASGGVTGQLAARAHEAPPAAQGGRP